MAAYRPIPPLVVRGTPSSDSLSNAGSIAWEILRRRADYQIDADEAALNRFEQGSQRIEFLSAPLPDPQWGLLFRGGPWPPGRPRPGLLAATPRSAGRRRRCRPDYARRQRRVRPFCDAGSDYTFVATLGR